MNPDAEPEDRVYDEIKAVDQMYTIVEQCLEEYNNTHKTRMNLVIFRYKYQEHSVVLTFLLVSKSCIKQRGRLGLDRMEVGFTTTYAINAYPAQVGCTRYNIM